MASLLAAAWAILPDLRLGQLISHLADQDDVVHIEDDVMYDRLIDWLDSSANYYGWSSEEILNPTPIDPTTLKVACVVGGYGTKHAVRPEVLAYSLCRLMVGSAESWRRLELMGDRTFDREDPDACLKCVSRLDRE
jgi:hypothetical protein